MEITAQVLFLSCVQTKQKRKFSLMFATYGVFTLPDSYADSDSNSDSINVLKGYTGTDSDGDSDGDSDAKLL